jgi:hypothetical protein
LRRSEHRIALGRLEEAFRARAEWGGVFDAESESDRELRQFRMAGLALGQELGHLRRMSLYQNKPEPFFELVVHDLDSHPGLTGACAGYEAGAFRNDELANYLFEWLPDFALKYSELEEFNSGTAMRLMRQAAKTVYTTDKYGKRGEFGELLLHALLREVFDSEPAISKIYYKSATNETVKGFDAVHVVQGQGGLELWLGEVKFYKDARSAVYDISNEILAHTGTDYLRSEFILIGNKVDHHWEHSDTVKDLISGRRSLDDVFLRVCIPAMVTYESECVGSHSAVTEQFRTVLTEEIQGIHQHFAGRDLPELRIHLFLVPLHNKEALVSLMHEKLKGLQA